MSTDERLKVFCASSSHEVFHSITHHHQIWLPDSHDVEIIHQQAREVYERLLSRVGAKMSNHSGRILLLLGKSGAGKTHLMRVFRNNTHEEGEGYFSYMQMTSSIANYARYVLRHTIESLDKVYFEPIASTSGLMRLSNALAEERRVIPKETLSLLRGSPLETKHLARVIFGLTDRLISLKRFHKVDPDIIRALLYLQRDDPVINSKIFKYLRCEPLTEFDCHILGGLLAKNEPDDPLFMLRSLALLIQAITAGALVICLDQLEDMRDMENADDKFRRAMQTIITLAEIPNVIIVVACLEDLYIVLKSYLPRTHIDRIELDPAPICLLSKRSAGEIELMIARRLFDLYESANVAFKESEPIYPFLPGTPEKLANLPTREVLNWCLKQHEQCIESKQGPEEVRSAAINRPVSYEENIELEQLWHDHLAGSHPTPEQNSELLKLLELSIQRCADEWDIICQLTTRLMLKDLIIEVDIITDDAKIKPQLTIGICQKPAQGRALAIQVAYLKETAGKRIGVIVRSTEFPNNPKTAIAKQIGEFIAQGGRRVVITDSDWRAMLAMESFITMHGNTPEFSIWLHKQQPLSYLSSFRQILDLEYLTKRVPEEQPKEQPKEQPEAKTHPELITTPTMLSNQLILGMTCEYNPQPVYMQSKQFMRHAAFLGGPGSGKTNLAQLIIEQLLMQGIPVILVDRKGDLSNYADPKAWQQNESPARNQIRQQLYDKLDIALYTPGATEGRGRGLNIPIVPSGLAKIARSARIQLANYAAMALGGLMGYRPHGQAKMRLAILGQAIAVLSELRPNDLFDIQQLIEFIASADPSLVSAIGRLDTKCFDKLVEDLETLNLMNAHLFGRDQELLNVENLFGYSSSANTDKTRLSIINTSLLGDNDNILFWVSQLLLDMERFIIKCPSEKLQGVIFFDEADIYLPAQSTPATKKPMESLLKRARSAGLGIMLATQSPGDLDYRSRDQVASWFVGSIKETTALNKLKPMLSEAKTEITGKLANQKMGEFFFINSGDVLHLKVNLALIKAIQIPSDKIAALASTLFKKTD